MSSEKRERLPFEPGQNKKKTKKTPPETKPTAKADGTKSNTSKAKKTKDRGIPEVVSQRMIRRMAIFCGTPTALAFVSFFVFYWIKLNDYFKVPTVAVLMVTLALFGLGVLGLSYGILSASWDEDRKGGWWGWQEFTVNFGRMTSAWRDSQKAQLSPAAQKDTKENKN